MEYQVTQDVYVQEFDLELLIGDWVYDGDLEPDLIAQLVSAGVLVTEVIGETDAEPVVDDEPDDDETE